MNGGVKSGEVPPLVSKGEVGEMDEDFDSMASNIEPYSKFKSTEQLMNSWFKFSNYLNLPPIFDLL